jgi:P4 family phage/plasmid primase-like protien
MIEDPQTMNAELLAAAEAYHELGVPVIPFVLYKNGNGIYEKENIGCWKKWEIEPQTDADFKALKWEKYFDKEKIWRKANAIGVLLGTKAQNGLYLSVVDHDTKGDTLKPGAVEKGKEILKDFPITRMVKTANNGLHYEYWSRAKPKIEGTFHDCAALELLGESKLCIMAGLGYQALNDNSPTEIENLEETFYTVLKKHCFALCEETELQNQQDNYSFSITKLIDLSKLTKTGPDEYQGTHPFHDSTTEKNFCVNTKANVWHCFRHNSGGGALQYLAMKEGLIKCEQAKKGALRGKKFHEVLTLAVASGFLDEKVLNQSEINPIILAKDIMEDYHFVADQETNELYVYNELEGIYCNNTEQIIKREIAKRLDENFKARYYTEINEFITATSPLVKMNTAKPEILAVKNGLLNVVTRELTAYSPGIYITDKLWEVIYNKDEQSHVWKEFIEKVIQNATQRRQVQQLIGHALYRKILTEICLICLGSGGNGKSIFLTIIKQFLGGSKNISSHTIQKLCYDKFSLAEIKDKRANICADLPQKELLGTGIFKALVSGDSVEIYTKYIQKTVSIDPTCKYLFSANNTPPVANEEDCYAWYRRFIFADFNVTFTKENSTPRQELLAKLSTPEVFSEILNWALDGLQELLKNGDVTERPTVEEIRLQYIRRSDTALAYFNDKVTITDNAENYVFTDVWFRDYVTYCHNKKIKPKTQGAFIGTIKQHLPGAEKTKIRPVPEASPLSAWRYVYFVPAVPGVPTSDTTLPETKKNEVQKKLNYEELGEKVGTGGTVGTETEKSVESNPPIQEEKRECGKCQKFRKATYPACSYPHGITANEPHCDYAENCQDYEGIEQLPRDESVDYPEPGEA